MLLAARDDLTEVYLASDPNPERKLSVKRSGIEVVSCPFICSNVKEPV
jgi:hypothetical protein